MSTDPCPCPACQTPNTLAEFFRPVYIYDEDGNPYPECTNHKETAMPAKTATKKNAEGFDQLVEDTTLANATLTETDQSHQYAATFARYMDAHRAVFVFPLDAKGRKATAKRIGEMRTTWLTDPSTGQDTPESHELGSVPYLPAPDPAECVIEQPEGSGRYRTTGAPPFVTEVGGLFVLFVELPKDSPFYNEGTGADDPKRSTCAAIVARADRLRTTRTGELVPDTFRPTYLWAAKLYPDADAVDDAVNTLTVANAHHWQAIGRAYMADMDDQFTGDWDDDPAATPITGSKVQGNNPF